MRPDEVQTLTLALVDNAKRLGLLWGLRPGRVTTVAPTLTVLCDGDQEVSIPCDSMVGQLFVGLRVYVMSVPPSGNYVVGFLSGFGQEIYNNVLTGDPSSGGTTSGSLADMPGPMQLIMRKYNETTRLRLGIAGTWFDAAGIAGTSPQFAINVAGASFGNGDQFLSVYRATLPAGVVRLPIIPMEKIFTGIGSGLLTLTARWARQTGTGTPSVAAGTDILNMTAEEII